MVLRNGGYYGTVGFCVALSLECSQPRAGSLKSGTGAGAQELRNKLDNYQRPQRVMHHPQTGASPRICELLGFSNIYTCAAHSGHACGGSPEVSGAKDGVQPGALAEHPATSGGALSVIEQPREGDVGGEVQDGHRHQHTVAPRACIAHIQVVPVAKRDMMLYFSV